MWKDTQDVRTILHCHVNNPTTSPLTGVSGNDTHPSHIAD
jgi:hypothetical protein